MVDTRHLFHLGLASLKLRWPAAMVMTILCSMAWVSKSDAQGGIVTFEQIVHGCFESVTTGRYENLPKGLSLERVGADYLRIEYSELSGPIVLVRAPRSKEEFAGCTATKLNATTADFDTVTDQIQGLLEPGLYERRRPKTDTVVNIVGCIPASEDIRATHVEIQLRHYVKRKQIDAYFRSYQDSLLSTCKGGL